MSTEQSENSKQTALSRILKAVAIKSSQGILYTSAILGTVALIPGVELPEMLATFAMGLGVEAMGSIIEHVARSGDISDDEIVKSVTEAVSKIGIDELLTTEDFYHAFSHLRKGQRSLQYQINEVYKVLQGIDISKISIKLQNALKTNQRDQNIKNNLSAGGAFIGRYKDVNKVIESLRSPWPIVLISGMGGIGKTALALECAHKILKASQKSSQFSCDLPIFDGIVWISARERSLELDDVLDLIVRTLEQFYITRLSVERKSTAVMELLDSSSTLVIVDNYESVVDHSVDKFLRSVPTPSKVLITSRKKLQQFEYAQNIILKRLCEKEAVEMANSEIDRLGTVTIEVKQKKQIQRLVSIMGGVPLAIKWGLGLAINGGRSPSEIIDLISNAKGDIFDALFGSAWDILGDPGQEILMSMSLFPASPDKHALAAVSGVNLDDIDRTISRLLDLSLLEPLHMLNSAQLRFSIHPLMRYFAGANLNIHREFFSSATRRMSKYYLDMSNNLPTSHDWTDRVLVLPTEDVQIMIGLANILFNAREWQELINLRENFWYFLSIKGYWKDRIQIDRLAIQAAEHVGNNTIKPWVYVHTFSWIAFKQGKTELSARYCEQGLKLFQEIGDASEVAFCRVRLALVANELKSYSQAEIHLIESLEYALLVQNHDLTLWILGVLGDVYCDMGNHKKGREQFLRGLKLANEIGWPVRIGLLKNKLAYSYLRKEEYKLAMKYFIECLEDLDTIEGSHIDIIARAKLGLCMTLYKEGEIESSKQLFLDVQRLISSLEIREGHIIRIIRELESKLGNSD